MGSKELSKQLSDLAERINGLPLVYGEADSDALLDLQDKLLDISNRATLKDLRDSDQSYINALKSISDAMEIIGTGNKKLDNIETAMNILNKVVEVAGKAVGIVTRL